MGVIHIVGQLLSVLTLIQTVSGKAKPINIFTQKNGADILQLRDKEGKMFNALFKTSPLKWNVKDRDGNIVIPYRIAAHYDASRMRAITTAMKRIEDNTCIRFKKRTNEWDYIEIQNEAGEGCYTSVGRPGGKSVLMLEHSRTDTCLEVELVLHELLHVVGLWHEHMRADRDKYIKVHYENIQESYWSQFDKVSPLEATTYNVPYDYKSIMHYDKTSFAQPGKISMETLDRKYQDVIGNQKDASPSDYRKVCEIYQCKKCMGANTGYGSNNGEVEPQATKAPAPSIIVIPSPNLHYCRDSNPSFCSVLLRARMIDCRFMDRRSCCATCKAIGKGKYNPFYKRLASVDRF
ncbi:hypothetical protein RB195_004720 [Necator americanus]